MSDNQLILLAPVSGVIYPLERVPDPVFSQKLAGDGISIDPTDNVLRAPCPGEILQQHAAGHAVTLKTAGDVEVLMHVGIDTVSLEGQGIYISRSRWETRSTRARRSSSSILDYIATNAKSLLTEVIISNGEVGLGYHLWIRHRGRRQDAGADVDAQRRRRGRESGDRADRDFRGHHSSKPQWSACAARRRVEQHGQDV